MARERVCFQLQVKPDRIEAYRAAHAAVWPDMLEALEATGWHNYSLFLREDGLVIGYFETDDLAASVDAMGATEVNARWQTEMSMNFVPSEGPVDVFTQRLTEIFHGGVEAQHREV
jgi:L-rhamnose mutarotase